MLTREDVRDELQRFTWNNFIQELKDQLLNLLVQETRKLSKQVASDLRDELRTVMGEYLDQASQRKHIVYVKELLSTIASEMCNDRSVLPDSWQQNKGSSVTHVRPFEFEGFSSKLHHLGSSAIDPSVGVTRAVTAGGASSRVEAWGVPVAPRSTTADSISRKRLQCEPAKDVVVDLWRSKPDPSSSRNPLPGNVSDEEDHAERIGAGGGLKSWGRVATYELAEPFKPRPKEGQLLSADRSAIEKLPPRVRSKVPAVPTIHVEDSEVQAHREYDDDHLDVVDLRDAADCRPDWDWKPAPPPVDKTSSPSALAPKLNSSHSTLAVPKLASSGSTLTVPGSKLPGASESMPRSSSRASAGSSRGMFRSSQTIEGAMSAVSVQPTASSSFRGWWIGTVSTVSLHTSRSRLTQNRCRRIFSNMVDSEYFDYLMGLFLILNAFSLGMAVNQKSQDPGRDEKLPLPFRVIDWCFCVIFTMELAARLTAKGFRLYTTKDWQWAAFDTVLVFFQILDELSQLLLDGTALQEVIEKALVLRMLRLGRIIRLIRMVRLIPELKSMVYLIAASMWSFFWTVVLLVLMMYCFAVYYTEVATELIRERGEEHATSDSIKKQWGSIMTSILSLYQAITGGDDWRNFIDPFDGDSSSTFVVNTLVFSLYIAFGTLVMLNLVTGVFVEGAQRIIKDDKDSDLVKQVCKMFIAADEDGSSGISWDEFEKHIDDPAMDSFFRSLELSRKDAKDLFRLLDCDNSGSLTVEEFVRGCMRLRGPARSVDLAALVYDFNTRMNENVDALGDLELKIRDFDPNGKELKQLMGKVDVLVKCMHCFLQCPDPDKEQNFPQVQVEGILV